MTEYTVPHELKRYLEPGEYVLWCGRPEVIRLFVPTDVLAVPLSLLWCGIVAYIGVQLLRSGAPPVSVLALAPFMLAGLYFSAGRFFYRKRLLEKSSYAVTNKRALILTGTHLHTVKGAPPDMRIIDHRDGTGTLFFGFGGIFDIHNMGFDGTFNAHYAMESIRNVNHVRQLILNLNRK